jgi:hypothetical protein
MYFSFNDPPGKITRLLLLVAALLVLASLIGQYSAHFLGDGYLQGFVPEFNLDREMNVPTWFSAGLFLYASLLLRQLVAADGENARTYWRGLACVFVFLSLDEVAAVHEMAVEPLRRLFHAGGLLFFSWVILGLAFVAVLALFYFRFFLSRPRPQRGPFLASAALFLAGTLGMEMIGGRYVELHGNATFTYALIANAEEALELFGLVAFIHALMTLLVKLQEGPVKNDPEC